MSERIKAVALRAAIENAGLTVAEYAARVGVTPPAMYQFISGQFAPSFHVLVRMCRELNKPAEELFPEHPWRKVENDAA